MTHHSEGVIGGVDTHKDQHVVVALSAQGQRQDAASFPSTPSGFADLLTWLQRFGSVQAVGMEGTGSWGAGLCAFLQEKGVTVWEVPRPSRQWRRRRGKSDPTDAEAAARAVLSGEGLATPTSRSGLVAVLRTIRPVYSSAIRERTRVANQLHAQIVTAPASLREELRSLKLRALVQLVASWELDEAPTSFAAAKYSLTLLAQRWLMVDGQAQQLKAKIHALTAATAPSLLAAPGVGPDSASTLLVALGDNRERVGSESAFAALCGVSPVDASSGRQRRHRVNRGGNRQANRALWVIARSRLKTDPRTQARAQRRQTEGLSPAEILRCLKRYIARELYQLLVPEPSPALAFS